MIRRLRERWDRRGGGPEARYIVELARRDVKRVKALDKARRLDENRRGVI